jgi:hypothetical protein
MFVRTQVQRYVAETRMIAQTTRYYSGMRLLVSNSLKKSYEAHIPQTLQFTAIYMRLKQHVLSHGFSTNYARVTDTASLINVIYQLTPTYSRMYLLRCLQPKVY